MQYVHLFGYFVDMDRVVHVKPSLYAFYFDIIKRISLGYGYNAVLHGSMARDLDIILIPWEYDLGDIDELIDNISDTIGGSILMQNRSVDNEIGDRFSEKPHGRVVYVVNINRDFEMEFDGMVSRVKDYSDPQYYIDISVMSVIK